MKKYKKLPICIVLMFVSFCAHSQFFVINITWINTDKPLLGVLGQKLAVNSFISSQQALIHTGLKDIKNSKVQIRINEYEKNKYDGSLKIPLAKNLLINNLLLGASIITPSSFPFYITTAKTEYFVRELAINDLIAVKIALARNNKIRNANTQELYSLNRKMLSKLKKTTRNAHKNAAFVIIASLLSRAATLPADDLNQIISLGL